MDTTVDLKAQFLEWGTAFLNARTAEMSIKLADTLLACLLNPSNVVSSCRELAGFKIATGWFLHLKLDVDPVVPALLAYLCDTPGKVVMYVNAIKAAYLLGKLDRMPVGMEEICTLFPRGFPTEEELSRLWQLQKLSNGSNLLDSFWNGDGE